MKHDELDLERRCRLAARRSGWVAAKLEKNGNKGIPDDLFLHPDGRFFLVEFKKDARQKARPEQEIWLARFPNCASLVYEYTQFCKLLGIAE